MMNTGVNEGSARIYQFPTGGRAALGGRRYGEAKTEFAAPPANLGDCSDSWYHAPPSRTKRTGVTTDVRKAFDRDAPDQQGADGELKRVGTTRFRPFFMSARRW